MAAKIVIDGRMFTQSGIGRYIKNLILQLQLIDKRNEYYILLRKKEYNSCNFQNNFHKVLADFHWYGMGEQIKLLGLLKELKPDLVHFPHFNVPVFYGGKYVVTIHDLIHQHFSMERVTTHGPIIYKVKQTGYKIIFKNALSKSSKILVPSQFVKGQLIKDWQVSGKKIVVTLEAVDDKLFTIGKEMSKEREENILKKFHIRPLFLFYIGNAHPHKNLTKLVKAFEILKKKFSNLSLVLSGNDHYFWQKMRQQFQQADIIYTGYVSDEELVALYKNAECFVMPSLEEGFGIPILEAMACECPVVSSEAGSLPEVGGSATVYFDPYSLSDMTDKIMKVLEDQKLRKQLISNGVKRYQQFSWKRLAGQTLEVYRKA